MCAAVPPPLLVLVLVLPLPVGFSAWSGGWLCINKRRAAAGGVSAFQGRRATAPGCGCEDNWIALSFRSAVPAQVLLDVPVPQLATASAAICRCNYRCRTRVLGSVGWIKTVNKIAMLDTGWERRVPRFTRVHVVHLNQRREEDDRSGWSRRNHLPASRSGSVAASKGRRPQPTRRVDPIQQRAWRRTPTRHRTRSGDRRELVAGRDRHDCSKALHAAPLHQTC